MFPHNFINTGRYQTFSLFANLIREINVFQFLFAFLNYEWSQLLFLPSLITCISFSVNWLFFSFPLFYLSLIYEFFCFFFHIKEISPFSNVLQLFSYSYYFPKMYFVFLNGSSCIARLFYEFKLIFLFLIFCFVPSIFQDDFLNPPCALPIYLWFYC